MAVEIVDCAQNSLEWFQARRGIPTSSEFAAILAKGKGKQESQMRRTYLRKLAGEMISGEPREGYENQHMIRGREMEAEARMYYRDLLDVPLHQVGFLRNGRMGSSPDSLVGEDGVLEIKSKLPHLVVDLILKDEFPPDHRAQCQGQLLVSEREWVDIVVYWPTMPTFIKRAHRDENYLSELSEAVEKFNEELDGIVEQVKAYRVDSNAGVV